jgi:outer membrane protein TolC
LPPEYVLRLTESGQPLKISVFEDVSDAELDQRLLSGRLELRAAEAAYRRADQELRLAILGQYPRLSIGPAFEHDLEGDSAFGPGISLELPLLNQNQGGIAAARAERDQRRAQYSALLHRLRSHAFAARAALRRARFEVEIQEREVLPLIERNQQLFEGAFGRRDVNIYDWITAQQRAVRSRREYLESLERYGTAATALEAATGILLSSPVPRPTTGPATQPATNAIPGRSPSLLRHDGGQEANRKMS